MTKFKNNKNINKPNITYFLVVSSFKILFLAFNNCDSFVFKSTFDIITDPQRDIDLNTRIDKN